MGDAEQVAMLKKIAGKLPQSQLSSMDEPLDKLIDLASAYDHGSYDAVLATADEVALQVDCYEALIRTREGDILVNFDRHVNQAGVKTLESDTLMTICRVTSVIYIQPLAGATPHVTIEYMMER